VSHVAHTNESWYTKEIRVMAQEGMTSHGTSRHNESWLMTEKRFMAHRERRVMAQEGKTSHGTGRREESWYLKGRRGKKEEQGKKSCTYLDPEGWSAYIAVCCSVLQCVAVCCNCAAVCCSVLHVPGP